MKNNNVYVVLKNVDRVEGRGQDIVHVICEISETAYRLAKGVDVQGSDGRVKEIQLKVFNDEYYFPFKLLKLEKPVTEDLINQNINLEKKLNEQKRNEAIRCAIELGLTEEQIKLIQNC